MEELKENWGDNLHNHTLHVKVWLQDWLWVETQNSTATTRIIRDGIIVERLGPKHRTFKPGFPFTAYVSIYNSLFSSDEDHYLYSKLRELLHYI